MCVFYCARHFSSPYLHSRSDAAPRLQMYILFSSSVSSARFDLFTHFFFVLKKIVFFCSVSLSFLRLFYEHSGRLFVKTLVFLLHRTNIIFDGKRKNHLSAFHPHNTRSKCFPFGQCVSVYGTKVSPHTYILEEIGSFSESTSILVYISFPFPRLCVLLASTNKMHGCFWQIDRNLFSFYTIHKGP